MIFSIFSCLILFPILISWGKFFSILLGTKHSKLGSFFLFGLIGICIFSSIWAFFLSVSWFLEVGILLLGLVFFYRYKIYNIIYNSHVFNDLYFWVSVFFCILMTSFSPFILDHFIYYVPSILWIQQSGWVQGVGNLDLVLGQMSFWHLFQSVFSNISDPYLRINFILILGFLIYIFEKKSYYLLSIFPYLYFFLQSPSVDMPAQIFALILLNEILLKTQNYKLLFAFSVFIFILKPTMFWCPMFMGLILINSRLGIKNYFLGFFLFLLYIIKNLYVFAYPFFPIFKFGLITNYTTNPVLAYQSNTYAQLKTFDMQYSLSQIQTFTPWQFFINWLTIDSYKSIVNIIFIFSIVAILIFCLLKNSKIFWFLGITILLKSLFIIYFSAQFRFFIDVIFVFLVLITFQINRKQILLNCYLFSSLATVFIFSNPIFLNKFLPHFRLFNNNIGFTKNQILEPIYFLKPTFIKCKIENLTFFTPINYPYNFNIPLPSISKQKLELYLKLGIFPQYLSEKHNSFKWIKLSKTQKIKLFNVINHINESELNKN